MNAISKRAQWVTGILVSLFTLVGGVWGATAAMDSRHVTRTEFQYVQTGYDDLTYVTLKREIRELRAAVASAQGDYKARLELDLQDAIDNLCRKYPDDRECK